MTVAQCIFISIFGLSIILNFFQYEIYKDKIKDLKWYEEQRNISNDFNMKLANKIDQLKDRLQKLRNIIKTKNHVTR